MAATVTPTPQTVPDRPSPAIVIGGAVFAAEIALTAQERQKGLSDRDVLEPLGGMLFLYAASIWMKGMRFALDLVWLSEECVVVRVDARVPPPYPEALDADLPRYTPGPQGAHVLEINAGEAESEGIEVGARVRFEGMAAETGGLCE